MGTQSSSGNTIKMCGLAGVLTNLTLNSSEQASSPCEAGQSQDVLESGIKQKLHLHSQLIPGVGASVDDVESRDRQDELLVASQISQMLHKHGIISHPCEHVAMEVGNMKVRGRWRLQTSARIHYLI